MNTSRFLTQLRGASSYQDLHCTLGEVAYSLEIPFFIYIARVPTCFEDPQLLIIDGYPEGWMPYYAAKNYHLCDPVLAAAEHSNLPFWWDDILTNSGEDHQRMMADARNYGLCHGISTPFRGTGGEAGLFSLAGPEGTRPTIESLRGEPSVLTGLVPYVHEAAMRILSAQPEVSFSDREKECLYWAVEGKTLWEIGQIIGVTERTVRFHLQNVSKKFGVANRQQAVAKAVELGVVKPTWRARKATVGHLKLSFEES